MEKAEKKYKKIICEKSKVIEEKQKKIEHLEKKNDALEHQVIKNFSALYGNEFFRSFFHFTVFGPIVLNFQHNVQMNLSRIFRKFQKIFGKNIFFGKLF